MSDKSLFPSSLTVNLLGSPISRLGMNEAVSDCLQALKDEKGGAHYFANVHTVTEATENPLLHHAFVAAKRCFADGVPLLWLARALGEPITSRVCGPDFVNELQLKLRSLKSKPQQAFVGGAPGQAETLQSRFDPEALTYCPPFRPFSKAHAEQDWQAVLNLSQQERKSPPRVVWVGLGAPKQELWIEAVAPLAPQTLFFGVGAAFDFLSNTKKRAPLWMQRAGLEWFFRLCQEPRRLFVRYFVTNTKFVLKSAALLAQRRKA